MWKILFQFFLCMILLSPSLAQSGNDARSIIEMLNHDIKHSSNPTEKRELFIYRARQFGKLKEWDEALKDYNAAIELSHKAWIYLERSHILMKLGKYELAYEDAEDAKKEVTSLSREADAIMDAAVAEVRKVYESENPITIIMDNKVDPYRKTRFDLMREQGVFLAKAVRSKTVSHKTSSNKTTKTACKPTTRRS